MRLLIEPSFLGIAFSIFICLATFVMSWLIGRGQMNIFYRQNPIWIKVAKITCVVSFILAFVFFGWFCYVVFSKGNEEATEKVDIEHKLDILIDSHNELIEKIDELINALENKN